MTRKTVSIIYTGGTFGMRASADGYVPARDLEALLRQRMPELAAETLPAYELSEYDDPLESSNATPAHWYDLAERIHRTQERFDGFVVIHGTDTLAYTASALSFLLAGLPKPVIVTGSQIPLCEPRSDAQLNLISAVQAIGARRLSEVCVCFGRHIYRGNRTTKVNASELDAFASPNFPPLAEIGTELRFTRHPALPSTGHMFGSAPPPHRDCNIAILPVFPGMHAGLVDAVVELDAAALVLRCYGTGTAPIADGRLLAALERARLAGVITLAVSQCQQGWVSLTRYAAGSALADAGVLNGFDMTTEAAFAKLHALFAFGLERAHIADLIARDLRGELTGE